MDISAQIKERMEDIPLGWGNYCSWLDLHRCVVHRGAYMLVPDSQICKYTVPERGMLPYLQTSKGLFELK